MERGDRHKLALIECQGRAGTEEGIVNEFTSPEVVQDRAPHQFDGLLRRVIVLDRSVRFQRSSLRSSPFHAGTNRSAIRHWLTACGSEAAFLGH